MAGTREGGIKAALTNRAKYGSEFYRHIGQKGGRNGHTGGFAANPALASIAGRKGGRNSRRSFGIENITHNDIPDDSTAAVTRCVQAMASVHKKAFPKDTHFDVKSIDDEMPYTTYQDYIITKADIDEASAYNRVKIAATFAQYLHKFAIANKDLKKQKTAALLKAMLRQILRDTPTSYHLNYPSLETIENAMVEWNDYLKKYIA